MVHEGKKGRRNKGRRIGEREIERKEGRQMEEKRERKGLKEREWKEKRNEDSEGRKEGWRAGESNKWARDEEREEHKHVGRISRGMSGGKERGGEGRGGNGRKKKGGESKRDEKKQEISHTREQTNQRQLTMMVVGGEVNAWLVIVSSTSEPEVEGLSASARISYTAGNAESTLSRLFKHWKAHHVH